MNGSAPEAPWTQADGTPIACRDKLTMLEENRAELQTLLRDVFEDAVLMGVDEASMRQTMIRMVQDLTSPLVTPQR